MPTMHRVYFDENEQAGEGYALWLPTSISDLERIGGELRDGLRVVIYWTGECEMEAVLKFDADVDSWIAVGDPSTYNDAVGLAMPAMVGMSADAADFGEEASLRPLTRHGDQTPLPAHGELGWLGPRVNSDVVHRFRRRRGRRRPLFHALGCAEPDHAAMAIELSWRRL
jgi:hypothetical protein